MAIYHCSAKIIGRSSGRSAVGSAAYRAGEKLENERDGMTHDYTRKEGVVHTEIMTPENAPEWTKDRGTLWNEVEKVETAKDAQLAREIEVALPNELDREQQKELLREYVKENFTDKGMVADIAVHDKGDGNPHAHIMLTTRPFEKDGSWGKKQKKEYILDKDGNKQYDPKKKTYKCKTVKTTDWDKTETLEKWREKWAEIGNRHLERAGHEPTLDHRSYEEQGIEKVPTVHLGPEVAAMEKRGIMTDRGDINREVAEHNRQLGIIAKREPLLEIQKSNILEELKELSKHQPKPYLTTVPEQRPESQRKQPIERHETKPYLTTVPESVRVGDLLKEARAYSGTLIREEQQRAQRIEEIKQRKIDIAQPYRAEVVEKYIQDKWGAEWTKVQKEKRLITQKLRDHADGKGYGMFDRLSGAYKRDGEELRHQSRNIDFREKDLISVFERTRQELINPRNIHAHGRYEVDRKADELAQARDPQYQAKMKTLNRMEEMLNDERKAVALDRKLMTELSRTLDKVKDKNQEISLPIGRTQEGRQTLQNALRTPETREGLINTLGKVNQTLERQIKTLDRGRGGMER